MQTQELLQRILADNSPEEEAAGADELVVARTRFLAKLRFVRNMSAKSAWWRYQGTKAMWERYGRQWKKDCGTSRLRHGVAQESIVAGEDRGGIVGRCLRTEWRLVNSARRWSW